MTDLSLLAKRLSSGIDKALFESSFALFMALGIPATILINGLWVCPILPSLQAMALDCTKNPFEDNPSAQWLLEHYLVPILAWITGTGQSLIGYALFSLILIIFGMLLVLFYLRYSLGDVAARGVLLIFAFSPGSLVALGWLGAPDGLTMVLGLAFVFGWTNPLVLFISGFLMGWNHFFHGVLIALIVTIAQLGRPLLRARHTLIRGLILIIFVYLGKFSLQAYFDHVGIIKIFSRFDYFYLYGSVMAYAMGALQSFGILIYSLFGVLWIFVLCYFSDAAYRTALFICCSIIVAFLTIFIAYDQTRVFSCMSLPILAVMLIEYLERGDKIRQEARLRTILSAVVLASLILPKVVVWGGKPYGSLIYHDCLTAINVARGTTQVNLGDFVWINRAFSPDPVANQLDDEKIPR